MPKIKLTVVGGLTEGYLKDAQKEYLKRLSRFFELEIKEIREQKIPSEENASYIAQALSKEAQGIFAEMKGYYNIALAIEGRQMPSEEFSRALYETFASKNPKINFLIGSSFGLSEEIKRAADLSLSFSLLTFPHQLARILLLEQLFRAAKIAENGKYHK